MKELQKTAHIQWNMLMLKYKTHFMGEVTLHLAQIVIQNSCNTIYPRNMVCFRYIIVNTLH